MRRFVLIAIAGLAAGGIHISPGAAETVCDPASVACTTVMDGVHLVIVDGAPGNPDPADGYISVDNGGMVCNDDNGTANDSASPTCLP